MRFFEVKLVKDSRNRPKNIFKKNMHIGSWTSGLEKVRYVRDTNLLHVKKVQSVFSRFLPLFSNLCLQMFDEKI
jgi:hypothetical protein